MNTENEFSRAPPCRRVRAMRSVKGFWRGTRGGVGVETALSIAALVVMFAGLIEIVNTVYNRDRLTRAAYAGARAVSLMADAAASQTALDEVVCAAARRELDLEADFDCTDEWTVTIEAFSSPSTVLSETPRGTGTPLGGENRDMVLIRLARGWGPGNIEVAAVGINERAEVED